jgi:DNA modification methylase
MQTKSIDSISISSISVESRQRLTIHNDDNLKESLLEKGTIQPIVLTEKSDGTFRLLAGGRRLHFIKELGHTVLYHGSTCDPTRPGFVLGCELPPDELIELELSENIKRSSMTWQEEAMGILTIHELKRTRAAIEGKTWTQKDTAQFVNIFSNATIQWNLWIGSKLRKELDDSDQPRPDARFYKCECLNDAIRLWMRDEQDAFSAELAKRSLAEALPSAVFEEEQAALAQFESIESLPDLLAAEREQYYSNPLNLPGSFDSYWEEKQKWAEEIRNTIYLSNKLVLGDSIKYMNENPGRFDHIITDIPYGIDMVMLNQQNPHGSMTDIDSVEELHDVEYNKELIANFFPAAFRCTKDRAFVITWCDQMLWQYMFDHATAAGFAVQRWPITWIKTSSCMNQCAGYNTTKDTEIAIVCRKPGTVLAWQPNTSVIEAGKDELCAKIVHPFAKPFAIWERLIKMATLENQLILEPFMGHGSGVISLLRMQRNFIGVELDQTHFNTALENIKRLFYLEQNPNFKFR